MNTQLYKKTAIYAGIFIAGILIGWLLLGRSSDATDHDTHTQANANQTWTCSMHPQIKQPEAGKCPICGMELIPLLNNSSSNDNPAQIEMSDAALKLANIQTSVVELSNTEKELYLQGKIEIDERLVSTQSVHFAGRIEKLYVAFEGEKVTKGQKLASIYSPLLVTAQEELLEAIKSKDVYPQLYTAAVNKLKLWKLTDAQIADIENNGSVQDNFEMIADVSGYVTKKMVSVGDYVKTGDMLFEIANLTNLWVMFEVYENDLPFISLGNSIDFTVNSLPSKSFKARISYIDPVLDSKKRTASIRTEVSNTNDVLKPEMFVNGKLIAGLSYKENALVVPKSAIMWTGKRSIVYVKVQNTDVPVFELREVELGEPLGSFYVVNSGIKQGDELVTNGTFSVDAAAQLNSKYSMMNPPIKDAGTQVPDYRADVSDAFVTQLNEIVVAYLVLKEDLIAANAESTAKDATALLGKLNNANKMPSKNEVHEYWMKNTKIMVDDVSKIANSLNIDTQRKAFKSLSDNMIAVSKSFGLGNHTVYVQYCPMANDDKGGFWLSNEKKVTNPYFGDMMLTCGEVKDSIQ